MLHHCCHLCHDRCRRRKCACLVWSARAPKSVSRCLAKTRWHLLVCRDSGCVGLFGEPKPDSWLVRPIFGLISRRQSVRWLLLCVAGLAFTLLGTFSKVTSTPSTALEGAGEVSSVFLWPSWKHYAASRSALANFCLRISICSVSSLRHDHGRMSEAETAARADCSRCFLWFANTWLSFLSAGEREVTSSPARA